MNGSTNLDWDVIAKSIKDLRDYSATDNELTCLTGLEADLTDISSKHCNFLGKIPNCLDPRNANGIAAYYKTVNDIYNDFISKLQGVLNYKSIDTDGAVSGGSAGGFGPVGTSGGYGGSSTSSSPATYVSGIGTPSDSTISDLSNSVGSGPSISSGIEMPNKGTVSPSSVASSIGTARIGSSPISSAAGAVAATGGVLGGLAASGALGDIGGLGSSATSSAINSINYPMGNYSTSENFGTSFSPEEKEALADILDKNGYSKDEIQAILNGEYGTSQLLVDSVSGELGNLININPEVRNQIIEQYGFDVFNADGTVNKDKLSMALFVDDMSGKDSYSMVSLLSDKYGVNLVDKTLFNNYSKEFEKIVLSDYSIKGKIIGKYGFDIYNPDGTINKDRLTLAMLIDSKNNNGNTLSNIINDSKASNISDFLNTNIKSVKVTPKKRNMSEFTPVAVILAAGGAAAGIAVATHNVGKTRKEKSESEKIDEIILRNANKFLDDKKDISWMEDIINE